MLNDEPNYTRILDSIASCKDVEKLTTFAANAKKRNVTVVKDAAIAQLKMLVPKYAKASFEYGFWTMLLEYQHVLIEHGKPTLKLDSAWKMAMREDEADILSDWIKNGHQAWVLGHLSRTSPKSLSAETLALKFSGLFSAETLRAAERNLALAKTKILETV